MTCSRLSDKSFFLMFESNECRRMKAKKGKAAAAVVVVLFPFVLKRGKLFSCGRNNLGGAAASSLFKQRKIRFHSSPGRENYMERDCENNSGSGSLLLLTRNLMAMPLFSAAGMS